jgi:SAM-dependent methyltransferase
MSMKVLPNKSSVEDARKTMVAIGASALESHAMEILRKLRLNRSIKLGDPLKSWDMLETIRFIQGHVCLNEPILDIGAYASEITVSLHKLGYTKLSGVDLNPQVQKMPFNNKIDYHVSDFMHTPFADGSFKAVTSISVIEHGLDQTSLLREMSRLLQVGGYFISSFDYWIDKIDTSAIEIFGMSWRIFSKEDLEDFVAEAGTLGLRPVGTLNFECSDRPVHYLDRDYTFGWLALEKVA